MITLSKRQADASNLLESIRKDPVFLKYFLVNGYFDHNKLKAATDYIAEHYSCGESEAEAVVLSLLRGMHQHTAARLSNRSAQSNHIEIPPTSDNPIGRKVPIAEKEDPVPPVSKPLNIDPTPPTTKDEKIHDVAKPLVQDQESRQQKIIDALQAHKITGNAFVEAMYGVPFTEDNLGKYV